MRCHLLLLMFWLIAAPARAELDDTLVAAIAEHETAPVPALLDRQVFLERPALELALLARDGRHVAFMTRDGLEARLQLLDTSTLATVQLLQSVQLQSFAWTEDSRSLILDLGNAIGVMNVAQPASASWVVTQDAAQPYRFLGSDHTTEGGILVVRRQADGTQLLQRIALDGASTDITRSALYIRQALMSADGSTAFLVGNNTEQRLVSLVRDNETTTLLTCPILTECDLLAYDDTTGTLWLTAAHDSNLRQLIAIAVSDQRVTSVHGDPQQLTDVFSVAMANKTPRIVQYQAGTVQNYGLDEAAQAMIEQIEAQVPAANLTLTLTDDAVMSLVRQEASDLGEARYHLFNRDSGSFIEILASTRNPALPDVSALSRKMPFDYRASDGFLLHGYLTLPQGISIAQAPLVALIHGGPWGRVFSSYSGYTQLLANRGYIVFEPNFRASTGYGLDYMTAANRDFGNGVVQQDITDGVRYLLANGIGNSDRVAIAGASFGGFSVLAGLAFTPELYKVGIAAVPPADMSDSARRLTSRPGAQHQDPAAFALLRALLVDMEDAADVQRLHAKSPQASLATITAPLLLLAGADDDRVSISHVKDYSLGLLNLGKEVSLLIDEDEGHGFEGGQAMNAYYYLTELMLAHYLQGRLLPLDDTALANYIERKLLLRAGPLQADHR